MIFIINTKIGLVSISASNLILGPRSHWEQNWDSSIEFLLEHHDVKDKAATLGPRT